MLPAPIGKIVKSNSHVDYVCQVFGPGEVEHAPAPADFAFGSFVAMPLDENAAGGPRLVGIIYNTLLLNPEFGSLGPRLSPRAETEIFAPDYLAETATLVGIIAVGWFAPDGRARHGVPAVAAPVNGPVRRLTLEELLQFHTPGQNAGQVQPSLHYAPLLLAQNHPLIAPLLLSVIDQLSELFPASRSQLAVVRDNLAWKSIVQPAG